MSFKLLTLQFLFGNRAMVPEVVRYLPWETRHETEKREERPKGRLLVPSAPQVSLAELLVGLEAIGYDVVDACYQPRVNKETTGQTFVQQLHMVRYYFARPDEERTASFHTKHPGLREELAQFCERYFWTAQAYLNPYVPKDGAVVPGVYHVSVNMVSPTPLWVGGKQELRWPIDANGHKVRFAPDGAGNLVLQQPQPLQPEHRLMLEGTNVVLLTP